MSACTTPSPEHDANGGTNSEANGDAGPDDADDDIADDTDIDGDVDPDTDPDNQTEPTTSVEAGAPSLVEVGTEGFLLRGTILTADGVLEGEVVTDGELISCVQEDCSDIADGQDLTIIDTEGVISPGLIDAHNHLPYNFLPPWIPPSGMTFANRYEWADNSSYEEHIEPYTRYRNNGSHYCPAAKWGELRSLLHGTTTIQGQSFQQRCVNWAVRNADHYHGLQHNHLRTSIASPGSFSEEQAQNYIDSFNEETNPTTRLAVHMAEGFEGDGVEDEFESFADLALLESGTAILIHAIPLNRAQLETVALTESKIVWSPSSNFDLYGYGMTAPIEDILEFGITVAMGPDWTISGEFDMLSEMRVAYDFGQEQEIDGLTPQKLWEMATFDGADTLGLQDFIGRLEAGYHADLVIFGRTSDDPYRAVLDSSAEDIELVLIDGQAYFGATEIEGAARNEYCESYMACGDSKFVCVQDSPTDSDRGDETLADVEQQLFDILEGTEDSPPEEQYGRGNELLDLVICE